MTAKKNKHHRIKLWSIRFPVLNDIERIFKQLQTCETFEPCDVVERLGHFDGIASSLACIPTKQHGVRGGKYLLNTPGDAISETLNFKMSLDASALKNLCLWCEFQSCLLFIISLLLKNFLTALRLFPFNLVSFVYKFSFFFYIYILFSARCESQKYFWIVKRTRICNYYYFL